MNAGVSWYLNSSILTPIVALIGAIVGGCISGFGGWMIAKGNRSHEFERERRRRKHDCLEAVMEKLDDAESAITMFRADSLMHRDVKHKHPEGFTQLEYNELLRQCMEDATESSKKSVAALQELQHYRTKLIVFGFADCANCLLNYCQTVINFQILVNKFRENKKTPGEYASALQNLVAVGDRLRSALTAAFGTL
jgi:hypothetical protein